MKEFFSLEHIGVLAGSLAAIFAIWIDFLLEWNNNRLNGMTRHQVGQVRIKVRRQKLFNWLATGLVMLSAWFGIRQTIDEKRVYEKQRKDFLKQIRADSIAFEVTLKTYKNQISAGQSIDSIQLKAKGILDTLNKISLTSGELREFAQEQINPLLPISLQIQYDIAFLQVSLDSLWSDSASRGKLKSNSGLQIPTLMLKNYLERQYIMLYVQKAKRPTLLSGKVQNMFWIDLRQYQPKSLMVQRFDFSPDSCQLKVITEYDQIPHASNIDDADIRNVYKLTNWYVRLCFITPPEHHIRSAKLSMLTGSNMQNIVSVPFLDSELNYEHNYGEFLTQIKRGAINRRYDGP